MIELKEQKASIKNLPSKPDFKLLYLVPLRNYVKKINVAGRLIHNTTNQSRRELDADKM